MNAAPDVVSPVAAPSTSNGWAADSAARTALHEYQTALEAGRPLDREAFVAEHPELAECLEALDLVHGVCRQFAGAAVWAGLNDATRTSDPVRLGEFRLVRELGRGGMGVVYEAVQEPLGRKVALKILPVSPDRPPQQLERFRREASLAAKLHHTNIVPVFAVGESLGLSYYAMQFIAGQSLDRWLHTWRAESNLAATTANANAAPTMATATDDSAASFQPAEQATGPLHNGPADPTPALLDPAATDYHRRIALVGVQAADALHYAHGQGVLHRDVKPANLMLDERREVWITDFGLARGDGQPELTQAGEVPGTLRYLAPERFRGIADARSDVYGLGLTLYELLTLRPAFPQEDRAQLLDRILNELPPAPRQLRPQVPRDLETIVLKCIAQAPEQRYATAGELADDLRRFLADAPIHARRVGPLERFWRWSRRNPALAGALAAAVVLLVAVSIVSSALAYRENVHGRRLSREKGQTADALAKAEQAIDKYVQTVKNAELLKDARFQPLLKDLLKDALQHYETLVAQDRDGDIAPARPRLADAVFEVAWINGQSGSSEAAIAAHQQAIALYRQLSEENAREPKYQAKLADSYNGLALLYAANAQVDDALAAHREALRIRGALADKHPADAQHQSNLASSHNNLANLLSDIGKPEAALAAHRQALGIRERLVRENPKIAQYLNELAGTHNNMGILFRDTSKPDEALPAFRQALDLRERLVRENPNVPQFRHELAMTHNNIALVFRETKRANDALDAFKQALKIHEPLARRNPTVNQYQTDLAGVYINLGNLYRSLRKPSEALADLKKAQEILERLVRENPRVAKYQSDLAKNHNDLGGAYSALKQSAEELAAYRQALAIQERLAEKYRTITDYQIALAGTYVNLASLLRKDDGKAALEPLGKAIELLCCVLKNEPREANARRFLRNAYRVRANAYDQLAQHAAAASDWEQALTLEQGTSRSTTARSLCVSLARAGQHQKATATADTLTSSVPNNLLLDVARAYAISTAAATRAQSLKPQEQTKLADAYAAKAIDLVERAAKSGQLGKPEQLKELETGADFASLRTHTVFRTLLERLRTKAGSR